MKVQGKVMFINPTKKPNEAKDFTVREICLDTTEEFNGRSYEGAIVLQFSNDKCAELDAINIGDTVEASYNVYCKPAANEKVKPSEKNPKGLGAFNNLSGFAITLIAKGGAEPSPAPSVATGDAKASDDLPF